MLVRVKIGAGAAGVLEGPKAVINEATVFPLLAVGISRGFIRISATKVPSPTNEAKTKYAMVLTPVRLEVPERVAVKGLLKTRLAVTVPDPFNELLK